MSADVRVHRIGPIHRVEYGNRSFSPSGARDLATRLIMAADEADRLTAEERVVAMPPGAARFVAAVSAGTMRPR